MLQKKIDASIEQYKEISKLLKDKENMHRASFANIGIDMFKKDTKLFLADPTVKMVWEEW